MKCSQHPRKDAVAQCKECGRGLCPECADKYEMPYCDNCAEKLNAAAEEEEQAEAIDYRAGLKRGLVFAILLTIWSAFFLWLGIKFFNAAIVKSSFWGAFFSGLFIPWGIGGAPWYFWHRTFGKFQKTQQEQLRDTVQESVLVGRGDAGGYFIWIAVKLFLFFFISSLCTPIILVANIYSIFSCFFHLKAMDKPDYPAKKMTWLFALGAFVVVGIILLPVYNHARASLAAQTQAVKDARDTQARTKNKLETLDVNDPETVKLAVDKYAGTFAAVYARARVAELLNFPGKPPFTNAQAYAAEDKVRAELRDNGYEKALLAYNATHGGNKDDTFKKAVYNACDISLDDAPDAQTQRVSTAYIGHQLGAVYSNRASFDDSEKILLLHMYEIVKNKSSDYALFHPVPDISKPAGQRAFTNAWAQLSKDANAKHEAIFSAAPREKIAKQIKEEIADRMEASPRPAKADMEKQIYTKLSADPEIRNTLKQYKSIDLMDMIKAETKKL